MLNCESSQLNIKQNTITMYKTILIVFIVKLNLTILFIFKYLANRKNMYISKLLWKQVKYYKLQKYKYLQGVQNSVNALTNWECRQYANYTYNYHLKSFDDNLLWLYHITMCWVLMRIESGILHILAQHVLQTLYDYSTNIKASIILNVSKSDFRLSC